MNRIEFQRSPLRNLFATALALAFVACGYIVQQSHETADRVVGRAAMVFFGAAAIMTIRSLIIGGTAVVLDDGGITDHRLGIGVLPWNAIARCSVFAYKGSRFLCLVLHEPELWLARMPPFRRFLARANRQLGFGHFALSFSALKPGIEEAIAFVRTRHPELIP